MRFAVVALFAALAAAVSACAAGPRHMPESHTLMIVAGDAAGLKAFEQAARRCGVVDLSRIPDGRGGAWVRMRGPVSTDAVIARYDCAKAWVVGHPDEVRLIGAEAPPDLWD